MPKPKGTRDKSTLRKLEQAAPRLEQLRAQQKDLYNKHDVAVVLSEYAQQCGRDIMKRIHAMDREIASLERQKNEWELHEKREKQRQTIRELVNSLVDQGIDAAEIIRQLGIN